MATDRMLRLNRKKEKPARMAAYYFLGGRQVDRKRCHVELELLAERFFTLEKSENGSIQAKKKSSGKRYFAGFFLIKRHQAAPF